MKIQVIRVDGTEEFHDTTEKEVFHKIEQLIKADCLDQFITRNKRSHVWVDDSGHEKDLPINPKATALYWEKCGRIVDHVIVGDVAITDVKEGYC